MAPIVSGDDGFFGWLQTFLYFAASAACFWRARASEAQATLERGLPEPPRFSEARVWLVVALCCLLLGLNKQLDAQTWLLFELEDLARDAGVFRRAYLVRKATLVLAAPLVLLAGAYVIKLFRTPSPGLRRATVGLALLGPFIALRMARFSGLRGFRGGGGALDVGLELLPTLVVLRAALLSDDKTIRKAPRR